MAGTVAVSMAPVGAAPALASVGVPIAYEGVFATTSVGVTAGYEIRGTTQMVVGSTGTTVGVVVSGLDQAKVYGAHLHNGTCSSGGGGHYQNVEGGETAPPNELWVTTSGSGLVPGTDGVANGFGEAAWLPRLTSASSNARSVVIHEPGGARIACADLAERKSTLVGAFRETAGGSAAGYDINGTAEMVVRPSGTTVSIAVSGLDRTKVYGAHLHNGSCASGGGGHYQDAEGGAAAPPNELWVVTSGTVLEPGADGVANGSGSADWPARLTSTMTNARSVVIHEPGGVRIACADLRQMELTGTFAGASGINGSVARLYMAVFLRQPDVPGHAYWVEKVAKGLSLREVARYFVASREFALTYDELDDAGFVNLLYDNVMGRPGEPAGVGYWIGVLAARTERADITLYFSDAPEFKNLTKTG